MRDTNPPDSISYPRTRFFAATAVLGLVACGACAPEALSWSGTIEERDGVVYVTNPAEPLWPSDGEPRLHLELEQVFGADESPAESILARIYDLTVGSDGHVYVLDYDESPEEVLLGSAPWGTVDDAGNVYVVDGRSSDLVAFAPDGTVRWRVSGPGQGPRDIQALQDLAWDGADLPMLGRSSGAGVGTTSRTV